MTVSHESSVPLVVVVGSTGVQGGSVIKALSESSKPYRIRGLTRDATKTSAQELAGKGVEMVSVTVSTENKEQVHKAFDGATYAFIVTNFWDHFDKERETAEGKMMIDAAVAAKVKLIIWSGLEDFTKASNGKYTHVDHFDGKAAVTAYGKSLNVPFANVEAGMYMSNFFTMAAPKKLEDGSFAIFGPAPGEGKTCLLDTHHDYGMFVREAIESSHSGQFSEAFAYGEEIAFAEIAKQLGEITGKKVNYVQASEEQFIKGAVGAGLPEAVANELLEMYQCIGEFGYFGPKDPSVSLKSLPKAPRTWGDYVRAHTTHWEKILN